MVISHLLCPYETNISFRFGGGEGTDSCTTVHISFENENLIENQKIPPSWWLQLC